MFDTFTQTHRRRGARGALSLSLLIGLAHGCTSEKDPAPPATIGAGGEASAAPTTATGEPAELSVVHVGSEVPADAPNVSTQDAVSESPAVEEGPVVTPPPSGMELDACDDPTHVNTGLKVYPSRHFRFHYLPTSAAAQDMATLVAARESAYAVIHSALGLEAEPSIDVFLLPSRAAAEARGMEAGGLDLTQRRYYTVYDGHQRSAESYRFGRYIAEILADAAAAEGHGGEGRALPLLRVGLGEYFDQSLRDLHRAYAERLVLGAEGEPSMETLSDSDVAAEDRARAGSLMQELVEAIGLPGVAAMLGATAVHDLIGDDCLQHDSLGCVGDARELRKLLDYGLVSASTERWVQIERDWQGAVEPLLEDSVDEVDLSDWIAIARVIEASTEAINLGDTLAYRQTMDGYYCDLQDEDARMVTAGRAVDTAEVMETEVHSILSTGVVSYPAARASTERVLADGSVEQVVYELEHFPVGWRITWASDWR
ncbi:MAG: hypothetical protein OEZ06_22235 [Myxococcales bacterium]|nr:hypothetical protein [Myxococcales bacterium]